MDLLSTITKLVTKNCFKAAIELKDAYYSIPIRSLDRKFLLTLFGRAPYMNSLAIPMVCHVLQGFLLKSLHPHYPLCISKVT